MRSLIASSLASRSGSVGISLTILSVALSGGFAIAQPTPGKTNAPEKTSGKTPEKTPTASQKPTASPKPLPTPETKIDAKTAAELLQAEDRFIIAIRNRDAKALSDLLADYYADSFRDDERAINKRGSIERATEGKLSIYRVEKERKLIRSGDTFTVEGLAKKAKPLASEENPKEEWVHVRRLWLRQGDRWLAIAQIITPAEEREAEKEKHGPEEKEKEPK
jgi:hypothetical protein